jgi:Ca-activated chloride channel family protein
MKELSRAERRRDMVKRASAFLIAVTAAIALSPAHAQEPPATNDPGTGALLVKMNGILVPVPALTTDVSLSIVGPMVRGRIVQTFTNPTAELLEGEYVFPLPEGAAVDGLTLQIGDRRYVGEIQEKEEARRTFEAAKAEGKGAGLVEQHRPNIFRTRVANIPPQASIVVQLDTLDEAEWRSGEFTTVFPTTITPRYAPGGAPGVDPVLGSGVARDSAVTLHATIEAGVPLAEVLSSHRVKTILRGSALDVSVGDGPVPADRDFTLRWRPKAGTDPVAGGLVEERADGRYGLAILVPPSFDRIGEGAFPTQTVFVIDVSGSMAGPSLEQAKAALTVALDGLQPEDTFTLIKFDSANEAYAERFLPASTDEIDAAKGWVSRLSAGSGTEILPALIRALDLSEGGDARVLRRVILITDGAVENEDEVVSQVAEHLGGTRLHIVGIGPAPNRWLMKELARSGRGTFESIGAIAEVRAKTVELLARTARAAMTDVALEWDGAPPLDVSPDPVPDLYAGQPLVVTARFDPEARLPKLRVWGKAPGGPVTMDVDFARASANAGIATRWARARIAGLTQSRAHGADPAVVRADVVALAKRFSLVTAYTSFVVVEDESYAAGDEGCWDGDVDGELPQSGTYEPLLAAVGIVLCGLGGLVAWAAARAGRLTS